MIGLKNYIETTFKRFIFNIIRRRKEIFPKILSVEFTSACNAKCIMCPQPDMDRKKENMSRETLDKIIKDCKGMPLKKINLFFGYEVINKVEIIQASIKVKKTIKINKLESDIKSQSKNYDELKKYPDLRRNFEKIASKILKS